MAKPLSDTDKARSYLKFHKNDLKRKYKVEGTAVGYKIKDGKYTEDISIIFYVKEKKNEKELSAKNIAPIPKKINGIPTDVVVMVKGFRPK